MPYAIIAVALVILGIAVAFMRLPHIDQPPSSHVGEGAAARTSVWSYRHTVLGALGIFVYVGVEVGLATTMVLYFSDRVHGGLNVLSVPEAQKLVLFYWLGALAGRLLGSWILTMIKAGKLLGIFGVTAAALVLVSIFSPGYVAVAALILAGFFNSIMFPNIAPKRRASRNPAPKEGLDSAGTPGRAFVRTSMKKLFPLLLALSLSAHTLAAQSLVAQLSNLLKPTAPAASATSSSDPLGRTTPSGTVLGFLQVTQDGNEKLAADYLQMSSARRLSQGPDMAGKLKVLMDRTFVGGIRRISRMF